VPREGTSAVRGEVYLCNVCVIAFGRREVLEEKLCMPFYYHQKIVEIVGNAARQSPHRLHFLRLAELLLEEMAFAEVLGHNEADSPPSVFQFVRNSFNLDHFAVFLAMLPIAMIKPVGRNLFQLIKISSSFLLRAKFKRGHAFELIQGISILTNGRIVHFQELQAFS